MAVSHRGDYLCRGLVRCGRCGGAMIPTTTARRGREYRKYYCPHKCGVGTVDMQRVDDAATAYIALLLAEEHLPSLAQALQQREAESRCEKARLQQERRELRRGLACCLELLADPQLPPEELRAIGERIAALRKRLRACAPPKDRLSANAEALDALRALRDAPLQRHAVQALIDRIEATKEEVRVISAL